MTAEEYIDKYGYGELVNYDLDSIINLMRDFARLKCEEQRELCAKEIKRNAVIFDILGINQETILNSPEPEI
jgi:spore coat polysaccharide biosynthesis predicted glycosyltransferase SpsG